jgi:hypothetical protein
LKLYRYRLSHNKKSWQSVTTLPALFVIIKLP